MSPDQALREFARDVAFLSRVSPPGRIHVRAHGEREPSKTEVLRDDFGRVCDALLASGWSFEQLSAYVEQKLAERKEAERHLRASVSRHGQAWPRWRRPEP